MILVDGLPGFPKLAVDRGRGAIGGTTDDIANPIGARAGLADTGEGRETAADDDEEEDDEEDGGGGAGRAGTGRASAPAFRLCDRTEIGAPPPIETSC